MTDRSALAQLWWELMQLPREQFYAGRQERIPTNLIEDAKVMSPGYVGRAYQEGGWLLVGHFPAGGTQGYTTRQDPADKRLYDSFRNLRDAGDDMGNMQVRFDAVADIWIQNQRGHRIYSNLIRHALNAGGLKDHDAAFLNIFPYRCRDNKPPTTGMRRAAWELAVSRQIDALRPGRIIALGAAVGDALGSLHHGAVPITVLRRSNGDQYLTPEAKRAIATLSGSTSFLDVPSTTVAPEPKRPRKEFIRPAATAAGASGWGRVQYVELFRELGFDEAEKGKTLKHWKAIPSIYFNIKADGTVYFTSYRKFADRFSDVLWKELDAQQSKDDKPHLMTQRPMPGKERAAFESLLDAA